MHHWRLWRVIGTWESAGWLTLTTLLLLAVVVAVAGVWKSRGLPTLAAVDETSLATHHSLPATAPVSQLPASAETASLAENQWVVPLDQWPDASDQKLIPIAPTPSWQPSTAAPVRYHGRRYVYWKTMRMRVTSYASDPRCCWPYSGLITASGRSVRTNGGHLVAADTALIPFDYLVQVPGYDGAKPVPVLDRGSAIHGRRLDVFLPTYQAARNWGVQWLRIKIYRPVVNP